MNRNDLDLLLLGIGGQGKSAAGNSILRNESFKSFSATTPVTSSIDFDYAEVLERIVKVVDTPGLTNLGGDVERNKSSFMQAMKCALAANSNGYHALLIPVRFGTRVTEEDINVFKLLKALFGDSCVKDFCIIVMTFGDVFYIEHGRGNTSFLKWCQEQKGIFKALLTECCNRIVLFDNKSQDPAKKEKQVIELFTLVDQLKGKRFKPGPTAVATQIQIAGQITYPMPVIKEDAFKEMSLILKKFKVCQNSTMDEVETLEIIMIRTEALISKLQRSSERQVCEIVKIAEQTKLAISEEIKFNVEMATDRQNYQRNKTIIDSQHVENKKRLQKIYSSLLSECPNDKERQITLSHEREGKFSQLEKDFSDKCKVADDVFLKLIREKRNIRMKKNREIVSVEQLEEKMRKTISDYLKDLIYGLFNLVAWPFKTIYTSIFGKK